MYEYRDASLATVKSIITSEWPTKQLQCQMQTLAVRTQRQITPAATVSLPADVQSASSLTTFRWKLKTHLFWQSYLDIVL